MKKIFFIIFIFTFACQPVEKFNYVVFDNNQFSKYDIFVKNIKIKEIFENKISEPYIGHTLEITPAKRIINWVNNNFKAIGNENYLIISILDASLKQTTIENIEAKNFDEKNNYKYELFYLVEFSLYDNTNSLIASALSEASRSTTSGMYISIQEKENIIDDLVYQSLNDLSNESKLLLIKYMGEFIL
tara:strand:- start:1991 stop:2554 length:564 start_codon:yes stop_codon:yes gene_type:complete